MVPGAWARCGHTLCPPEAAVLVLVLVLGGGRCPGRAGRAAAALGLTGTEDVLAVVASYADVSPACPRPSAPQTQLLGLTHAASHPGARDSSGQSLVPTSRGLRALALTSPTLRSGSRPPRPKLFSGVRQPSGCGMLPGSGEAWSWAHEVSVPVPVRAGVLAATLTEPGGDRAVAAQSRRAEPFGGTPGPCLGPWPQPHPRQPAPTASWSRAGLGQAVVIHEAGGTAVPAAALTSVQGPRSALPHPHCQRLLCGRRLLPSGYCPDVEAPGGRGAFPFCSVAVGPCSEPRLPPRGHGTLSLLRDGHPLQAEAEGVWAPPRWQRPHDFARARWPESARRASRSCKGVGERAAPPGARVASCGAGAGPPGTSPPRPQSRAAPTRLPSGGAVATQGGVPPAPSAPLSPGRPRNRRRHLAFGRGHRFRAPSPSSPRAASGQRRPLPWEGAAGSRDERSVCTAVAASSRAPGGCAGLTQASLPAARRRPGVPWWPPRPLTRPHRGFSAPVPALRGHEAPRLGPPSVSPALAL
ncbi:transcription initiation factor TFIID subunit 4-like [Pteropus vampyrus]|uniref:Transcription initiation factor TFIID subunit 4-like n=1 Tax=Pteropus vampyrus TaxID=132908 RepID=A0A6P6BTN6_PTEVA|nr:transcription initiation factor TFIID subunit 4-like [Pteropus vampyrus]